MQIGNSNLKMENKQTNSISSVRLEKKESIKMLDSGKPEYLNRLKIITFEFFDNEFNDYY